MNEPVRSDPINSRQEYLLRYFPEIHIGFFKWNSYRSLAPEGINFYKTKIDVIQTHEKTTTPIINVAGEYTFNVVFISSSAKFEITQK